MESELDSSLRRDLDAITGKGYQTAFEQAQDQFNKEQDRLSLNTENNRKYGLDALKAQQTAGATQRDIESEGILADYGQFKEERDYPFKMVQYIQSLLQGQPLQTESYSYEEPSGLSSLLGGLGGIGQVGQIFGMDQAAWTKLLGGLFGGGSTPDLSDLTDAQLAMLNLPPRTK
jgi:hypothetical protein